MSTKTTVYLDPDSYRRLKALAAKTRRPAAELIREAVLEYVRRLAAPVRPRSLGTGSSGKRDLGSRAEELLKGMGEP